MPEEDAGVQCVSWAQFQAGLAAVFIASALFTVVALLIVVPASNASNTNTTIINDPRAELRQKYAEKAWAELKEKTNGL